MKFTKIALSVVAVLGAVAVGGSWYTGKQAEEHYHQLVEQANKQLKQSEQYGAKAEIKEVKLTRHFFSSDVTYRLEAITAEGENFSLIGNDKIYHGPLPLNRLSKFNLVPVMMSMENNLHAPEQMKAFFGDHLGKGTANVSYSGNVDGEFVLSAVKYSDDKGSISSSPVNLRYDYDRSGKRLNGKVDFEKFDLQTKENDTVVQLDGLEYQFKQADDQGYPYLGLGEGVLKLKSAEIQSTDMQSVERDSSNKIAFKDAVIEWKNALNGERVLANSKGNIGAMNLAGIELGKTVLDIAMDFDAKAMNKMSEDLSNPEALMNDSALDSIWDVLGKTPKIQINNFSLDNGKGKVESSLLLNVAQFEAAKLDQVDWLSSLSPSKLTFEANRGYIEEFGRQAAIHLDKLSEAEAAEKAKSVVETLFSEAGPNEFVGEFVQVEGDKLKSSLLVEQGKLSLNGRVFSDAELQMLLFALMMGLGSVGE